MKIIARINSDFKEKFGIPRQSGLALGCPARIVFEPEFRSKEALRGIEEYSHLWLIWEFSTVLQSGFSPTVRPPRLGGNKRVGVFATRSPFRPNPIGLSCVKLIAVEDTVSDGTVLIVDGADLLDGTPIYDVKPYLSYTDSHPNASSGFADRVFCYSLPVEIPTKLLEGIPDEKRNVLIEILSEDPRPAYKSDSERIYAFRFWKLEIFFKVEDGILTVTDIKKDFDKP